MRRLFLSGIRVTRAQEQSVEHCGNKAGIEASFFSEHVGLPQQLNQAGPSNRGRAYVIETRGAACIPSSLYRSSRWPHVAKQNNDDATMAPPNASPARRFLISPHRYRILTSPYALFSRISILEFRLAASALRQGAWRTSNAPPFGNKIAVVGRCASIIDRASTPEEVEMIPEILATVSCGLFAGAAIYINLVEQPARLSCGVTVALTEWRSSYKRASVMQASLAVLGSLLAFSSWWLGRESAWLVGGVLLFAVIPFTLIVIFPTNKKLQSEDLDLSSAQAAHLLHRWSRLHAVRSGLSFAAFLIFLFALRDKS